MVSIGRDESRFAALRHAFPWLALILPLLLTALIGAEPAWEGVEPPRRKLSRYEHIWKDSPFVAVTESVPVSESLGSRFALLGFVRVGSEEIAYLLDRKNLKQISISSGDETGAVRLESVAESGDIETLRVKIRAGSEVGELRYDSDAAASVAVKGVASSAPAPQPTQSGVPAPSPSPAGQQVASSNGSTPKQPAAYRVIRRRPITVTNGN